MIGKGLRVNEGKSSMFALSVCDMQELAKAHLTTISWYLDMVGSSLLTFTFDVDGGVEVEEDEAAIEGGEGVGALDAVIVVVVLVVVVVVEAQSVLESD
eukprot:CAMPEP_0171446798 /NCGR_PEP_ID=MMETSP0881-20121228/38782_1 /TAXON_ID=67004 /ORGANISM="Thalassiosira weissflogii, Strain CCMP1336" /LENGTH=98 /DNA_ID=CAMNT_0011971197 /DNA_START=556 /DNA_END=849 /DNA_ORIENTATION=-